MRGLKNIWGGSRKPECAMAWRKPSAGFTIKWRRGLGPPGGRLAQRSAKGERRAGRPDKETAAINNSARTFRGYKKSGGRKGLGFRNNHHGQKIVSYTRVLRPFYLRSALCLMTNWWALHGACAGREVSYWKFDEADG